MGPAASKLTDKSTLQDYRRAARELMFVASDGCNVDDAGKCEHGKVSLLAMMLNEYQK